MNCIRYHEKNRRPRRFFLRAEALRFYPRLVVSYSYRYNG